MYANGVQQSTDTLAGSFTSSAKLVIGPGVVTAIDFDGFIDDVRVTSGICRYPDGTTFTPRTIAAVADNCTVLLLPFDGADASTTIPDTSSTFD